MLELEMKAKGYSHDGGPVRITAKYEEPWRVINLIFDYSVCGLTSSDPMEKQSYSVKIGIDELAVLGDFAKAVREAIAFRAGPGGGRVQ